MRAEAPSGAVYTSKGSQISPLEAERNVYPQNNHHFPENRREFLESLARELPAALIDWLSLGNDSIAGFNERNTLLRELRNGLETSKGDGSFVAVNPGFGSMEWWYDPTVDFFVRKGRIPVILAPDLIVNLKPIEKKKERHMEIIIDLHKQSGQKVHVIGDSQGGLEAAAMAVDYPKEFQESVEDVWFIGAPKPRRVNVIVGIAYLWSQLWHGANDFQLAKKLENLEELEEEGKVPFRSIYKYSDVVLRGGIPIGKHFKTGDSHIGGAVNLRHLNLIDSTWSKNGQSSENEWAAKAVAAA